MTEVVMTEASWLTSSDPKPMLQFLRSIASQRQLRLFACACCRRIWPLIHDEVNRRLVESAERLADGDATAEDQVAVARPVSGAGDEVWRATLYNPMVSANYEACLGVSETISTTMTERATLATASSASYSMADSQFDCASESESWDAAERAEAAAQATVIRDIFGNPFHPRPFHLAWLTDEVTSLATIIYQQWSSERMPDLARLLENTGCRNEVILTHCRNDQNHVRGCWVIDLLLGKQ